MSKHKQQDGFYGEKANVEGPTNQRTNEHIKRFYTPQPVSVTKADYDEWAKNYEQNTVQDSGYCAPEIIVDLVCQKSSSTLFARNHRRPCLPEIIVDLVCQKSSPILFARNHRRPCLPEIIADLVRQKSSSTLFAKNHRRPCLPKIIADLVCQKSSPTLFASL